MAAIAEKDKRAAPAGSSNLTYSEILRFYLPLACSWVFMAIEAPSSVAIISRLPNKDVETAAFYIMMGIALFTESPIIDLLSTSTTLCKNKQAFGKISKFVWYLLGIVTAIHVLIVFTPLYGLLMKVLQAPPEVAKAAHAGLVLMVPWAGAIAWRRYRQGILIRFGWTRTIGVGTAVRVCAINIVGWSLFGLTHLTGTQIVGIALICSVSSEAIYIHLTSKALIREKLSRDSAVSSEAAGSLAIGEEEDLASGSTPNVLETKDGGIGPLSMNKLVSFHLPLVLTTMVVMVNNPIVAGAMDRGPQSVLAMASWQVAATLIWLFRTITFALPEVVITLYKDDQSARMLRSFSIRVGLAMTGALLLLWATRIDTIFFRTLLEADPKTCEMAHFALLCSAFLPIVNSAQSYVRGMLTAYHMTVSRFTSVIVSISVVLVMLSIGVHFQWPGVLNAGLAFTVAMCAELSALYYFWTRRPRAAALSTAAKPV